MQTFDFNNLERVIPRHLWKMRLRVEQLSSAENARSGLLGLDIGTRHIGVAFMKPQSNEIEGIKTIDRAKLDEELPELIKKYEILGMVVKLPTGTHNYQHVTSFVDQLDKNDCRRGVPFCYFS